MDKIQIVYYHGKCADGFGSAMTVYHYFATKFSVERAKSISYLPYFHSGSSIDLDLIRNKSVLLIDFSLPLHEFNKLIETVKWIKIIDHHPLTEKLPKMYRIYSSTKAAVELTWSYFFATPLPKFLSYIARRDMGDFSSVKGMSFCKYLDSQALNFKVWRQYLNESSVTDALNKSAGWHARDNVLIITLMKMVSFTIYEINDEYRIAASINTVLFRSEIGDRILKKYPFVDFAMLWSYSSRFGQTSISLRSKDFDVNEVAKDHNGGGHRNASSCMLPGCDPELNYFTPDYAQEFITMLLQNKLRISKECDDIINGDKYDNLFGRLFPDGCTLEIY